MAVFLGLAAGFRSFALGAFGRFALGATAGFVFGLAAFLDIADARISQRAGARGAFILGQRAQHDAGPATLRLSA